MAPRRRRRSPGEGLTRPRSPASGSPGLNGIVRPIPGERGGALGAQPIAAEAAPPKMRLQRARAASRAEAPPGRQRLRRRAKRRARRSGFLAAGPSAIDEGSPPAERSEAPREGPSPYGRDALGGSGRPRLEPGRRRRRAQTCAGPGSRLPEEIPSRTERPRAGSSHAPCATGPISLGTPRESTQKPDVRAQPAPDPRKCYGGLSPAARPEAEAAGGVVTR